MKSAKGMTLKNINLMATNPNKEQFAPTPAQPIRQRARMGGDPIGDANAGNAAAMEAAGQSVKSAPADKKKIAEAVRTINDSTQGPGNATLRNYNKAIK